jgi:hypothetical protein
LTIAIDGIRYGGVSSNIAQTDVVNN